MGSRKAIPRRRERRGRRMGGIYAVLPARDGSDTAAIWRDGFREAGDRARARSDPEQDRSHRALFPAVDGGRTILRVPGRRADRCFSDPKHMKAHNLRFDAQRVLLDPFAEQVFFPPEFSRAASMKPGANAGRAPLGALPVQQAAAEKFTRPRHQCHDTFIYELHVKGFTAGVTKENRGKFLGLVVARKEPGHEQAPAARATVEPSTRRPGSISE